MAQDRGHLTHTSYNKCPTQIGAIDQFEFYLPSPITVSHEH